MYSSDDELASDIFRQIPKNMNHCCQPRFEIYKGRRYAAGSKYRDRLWFRLAGKASIPARRRFS
jgi:hypothetical protein